MLRWWAHKGSNLEPVLNDNLALQKAEMKSIRKSFFSLVTVSLNVGKLSLWRIIPQPPFQWLEILADHLAPRLVVGGIRGIPALSLDKTPFVRLHPYFSGWARMSSNCEVGLCA